MVLELLAIPIALAAFQYQLAILFLNLPNRSLREWSPRLMWDSALILLLTGTVGLVQILTAYLKKMVESALEPTATSGLALPKILTQLTFIDGLIIAIVAALSSTVIFVPVAEAVVRILTIPMHAVTGAIILWSVLAVINTWIQQLSIHVYVIGVCLWSFIFRVGRTSGGYLLAAAIILPIGIPLAPYFAMQVEGFLVHETSVSVLEGVLREIQSNPLLFASLIPALVQAVAGIMVSVIIALILFPIFYVWTLGTLIRSLAHLLGGGAAFNFTSSIVATSNEITEAAT